MALAITVTSVVSLQKEYLVRGTIVATGNYVTGGDILDFTPGVAIYNLGVDGIKSSSGPKAMFFFSATPAAGTANTTEYVYEGRPGLLQNNSKMQVFTGAAAQAALAELAGGAYPAGVLNDTIVFQAFFSKL